MKIAILGAGHGGTTVAADLIKKGHQVTLVKTSHALHNEHFEYVRDSGYVTLTENGTTEQIKLQKVTDNLADGIRDAELIIIYIQTIYHEALLERLLPLLRGDETLLFEPGYLATAYVLKHQPNTTLTIIEAESSPIDCRIIEPGYVEVLFRNALNLFSVYPYTNTKKADKILDVLQYPFVLRKSLLETALYNPNLIVHTVGAIMSAPRIEYTKGEYWMYKEVFTPSVWHLVNTLDKEKQAVLQAYDIRYPLEYLDTCAYRNDVDFIGKKAIDIFRDYAMNHSPKGPSVVKTRFIVEDVSQGLVLLESLGQMRKVETPITTALINIAQALLQMELRVGGRSIAQFGLDAFKAILNNK